MTSLEHTPSDQHDRRTLYDAIGRLAKTTRKKPLHGVWMKNDMPVNDDVVPPFITQRLPTAASLAVYSAVLMHAENSTGVKGGNFSMLSLRRTTMLANGDNARWDVTYEISEPGLETTRVVTGIRYPQVEPYHGGVGEGFDFGRWFEGMLAEDPLDVARPLSETSGPWPEAGLVIPEGEQLIRLIGNLAQQEAN